MLRRVYGRLMEAASHRHALLWLAAVSFIEASVFPIPPDVMLVPMVLADRRKAWRFALVATLASVAGGWLGYAIGALLFDSIGRPVIAFYHLQDGFAAFQAMFTRYGGWIIFAKGWTPIPFKLLTITAGFCRLDPLTFTIASIASRALRFFIEAWLLRQFGPPIRNFVERRLTLVSSLFLACLVGGFLALRFL